MQLPMEALIYVAIFVGVLALVEGIYLVAFGKSISLNSRVNRRLDMLDKGAGREQVLEQLRKEMQQHMKTQSIPLYSLLADKAQKAAIAFYAKTTDHDHGSCFGRGFCSSQHWYGNRYGLAHSYFYCHRCRWLFSCGSAEKPINA